MENKNNIDDLLNKSFENFEAPVSQNLRLQMSKKVVKFNFFKFNPGTFNIFYLAPVIIGASIMLVVGINSLNDNTNEHTTSDIINIETENHISNPSNQENIIETEFTEEGLNTNEDNAENTEIFQINEATYTRSTYNKTSDFTEDESSIILKEKIIVEDLSEDTNAERNTNLEENSNKIVNETITTEDKDEVPLFNNTHLNKENSDKIGIYGYDEESHSTKIIYDTIVSNQTITVRDTVKTVVNETLKIKKPRKRNNK